MAESTENMKELAVRWTQAQPAVAAYISSLVPDFHDAEDLLQQVAVAIVNKFEAYERDRPFIAWAIGIAKLEVLNYRRKRGSGIALLDQQTLETITRVYETAGPELDELRRVLDECIHATQGKSRQVLELRYVREMSPTAIARRLGTSTNAVFVMLHRVRLALRNCVDRKFGNTPEAGAGTGVAS